MFKLQSASGGLAPQVAPTVSLNVIGGRAVYTTHRPVGYLPRDVVSLRIRHESALAEYGWASTSRIAALSAAPTFVLFFCLHHFIGLISS